MDQEIIILSQPSKIKNFTGFSMELKRIYYKHYLLWDKSSLNKKIIRLKLIDKNEWKALNLNKFVRTPISLRK